MKVRPYWLIPLIYVFVMPIILAGLFSSTFQFISISGCIFLIVLLPFWSKKNEFDLFSPWAIICYRVFLTVFLAAIYVTFDLPNADYIKYFYLKDKPKEFLLLSSLYVLTGMLFLTFGYLFQSNNRNIVSIKIFKSDQWNSNRFNYVTIVLLLLSWVGFYYYIIYAVQGSLIENISAYRRVVSTELSEYRSYGYFSWTVSLSTIVSYLTWVRIISQSRGGSRLHYLIFILSSVTALSFSIISGVRSGVVVWFIALVAISYYIRNGKWNISFKIFFIVVFILTASLFKFMTDMRAGQYGTPRIFDLFEVTAPFIASGNGIDISKTGYIIESIPEKMDFQFGGTFVTILYAWIPREIWPNKPIAALDGIIAMKIYDAEAYGGGGIPPGLIAELYLNYWLIGIPLGCFLAGRLIKKIYVTFKEYRQNRNVIIIYVACFMELGFSFMGSGFVSTLIGFLMTGIPLFIILNLVTKSGKLQPKYRIS